MEVFAIILALACVVPVIVLCCWACHWDGPAPFFNTVRRDRLDHWFLHHCEKITMTDARAWLWHRRLGTRSEDLRPYPPIYAFGLASALPCLLGFASFGLTNRGMRVPFLLMNGAACVGMVLCLQAMMPWWAALTAAAILLLNANQLHYMMVGVIEHVTTIALIALITVLLLVPATLLDHPWIIGFAIGVLIWVKQTCMGIVAVAFVVLSAALGGWLAGLVAAVACLLGAVLAEALQLLVMARLGWAGKRLQNLREAFALFTGRSANKVNSAVIPLKMAKLRIYPYLFRNLAEWLWFTGPDGVKDHGVTAWVGWAFLSVFSLTGLLCLVINGVSHPVSALFLALMVIIGAHGAFSYWLKRSAPLFLPILLCQILLLETVAVALMGQPGWSLVPLAGLLVLQVMLHGPLLRNWVRQRRTITKDLADGLTDVVSEETIYAHNYCQRFFWQAPVRFKAGDDQWYHNQDIIEWLAKERGTYLMTSAYGRDAVLPDGCRAEKLGEWPSTPAHMSGNDTYTLFRITWV
ncbi:MAG: hypothetical protein ACPGOY_04255 [Rhodospirillaceae bacterium]